MRYFFIFVLVSAVFYTLAMPMLVKQTSQNYQAIRADEQAQTDTGSIPHVFKRISSADESLKEAGMFAVPSQPSPPRVVWYVRIKALHGAPCDPHVDSGAQGACSI